MGEEARVIKYQKLRKIRFIRTICNQKSILLRSVKHSHIWENSLSRKPFWEKENICARFCLKLNNQRLTFAERKPFCFSITNIFNGAHNDETKAKQNIKAAVSRDFWHFFHESNPPRPVINRLQWFC